MKYRRDVREREVTPEAWYVRRREFLRAAAAVSLAAAGCLPGDEGEAKSEPAGGAEGPAAPTVSNGWQGDLLFDQLLLREGTVVARVDNRSATAISKKLENVILKSSGEPETKDLLAAVRWLKRRPWVDGDRVGVWGWSGGGTFTLLAMTRSQEFKAGIAVAPLTDFRYYDTKFAETYMKTPAANPDGYEYTTLVRRAKDLHGRVLLVHGTYDDNVHPQSTLAFADELIKAGQPFDMMMFPMRKHGITDRPARIHLFNKVLEFWKLYL